MTSRRVWEGRIAGVYGGNPDKARELDKTIRKLTAMRDGLKHAAVCPAPSHMECPTFRRLLGIASPGVTKQKGRALRHI